ncbi:hypothetical protein SAMN05443252_101419 [Bacillus sp. OV322]|uniref:hypothetical protein n=1 Tax=Bacillus sp. OV322 TaxID=1882764 RepID=UPI0008E1C00B|nr:hypothetical protein [Bacillus sp. OV322]SFC00681.1 hypothetical protein SAMN05443252_101419 [Bacillus sp. OV322]
MDTIIVRHEILEIIFPASDYLQDKIAVKASGKQCLFLFGMELENIEHMEKLLKKSHHYIFIIMYTEYVTEITTSNLNSAL